jgi:hypothetical protein
MTIRDPTSLRGKILIATVLFSVLIWFHVLRWLGLW